jgi:hypothetical protein
MRFDWWMLTPVITGGLLILALWCPNLTLTWILFGLAVVVAFGPAAAFIVIDLSRTLATCIKRST